MNDAANEWVIQTGDVETRLPSLSQVADLLRTRKLASFSRVFDPERNLWTTAWQLDSLRTKLRAASRLRTRNAIGEALVSGATYAFVGALVVLAFQLFVYLRDGEWPGASLYDLMASNVSEVTANAVRAPQLSAMREVHAALPPVASFKDDVTATNEVRLFYLAAAERARISPDLRPLQLWLVAPSSWYGLHATITGFLRNVSVAGLLMLVALLLAWVGLTLQPGYDAWDHLDRAG